ncbi:MAG TPA: RNA polymerase sigma factor [Candidatus Acidoferrales bacterium]|nr:RNA polymerase sigma factor [Candidatus Acidoferrales bacterium]
MNLFTCNDTKVNVNDEQLVAVLKAQDPAAVQELLDLHGSRLLRSAYLLCGNETEAQDFVQETFLQAIRSVHRFQGRSAVYTWLHAILLNVVRQAHRDNARLVYDNDLLNREVAAETPSHLDAETASSALRLALQQLSAPHREVIVLRYYENMKIHEMAKHLGVSKGTVKSRLHYAIQELQKFLPGELNLFGASDTERMQKR